MFFLINVNIVLFGKTKLIKRIYIVVIAWILIQRVEIMNKNCTQIANTKLNKDHITENWILNLEFIIELKI